MTLSKDFTLAEMTKTRVLAENSPTDDAKEKLLYLCNYIMQPIRNRYGQVIVNSAYRSETVNKAVGGSRFSQHLLGEACDFVIPNQRLDEVFIWCKGNLSFGQLILENKQGARWIHISLPRINGNNMQIMTCLDGKYYLL